MSKHTPGPWHVMKGPDTFIRSENGENIARICVYGPTSETPWAERENARLIAAAPELLDALFRAASAMESVSYSDQSIASALDVARTAITKATGNTA